MVEDRDILIIVDQ